MSTAQFTTPLIVVIPGQLITASLWNNEYTNLFTNLNPQGIGAYSDTDAEMQTSTDPFPSGTSRPTAISGEIERIRYMLNLIIGQTYWYQHPSVNLDGISTDISDLEAKFPIQTADIGDIQVTNEKINSVASTKITGQITTAQITDANVTEAKLSSSVAGNGLAGGAGTALSVNVDNSTIEINSGILRVKDAGITSSKLASGIIHGPLSDVSSLIIASSVNGSFGTAFSFSGSGALKGITLTSARNGGSSGSATFSIRITIDGTAYTVGSLLSNNSQKYFIVPAASWTGNNPPVLSGAFSASSGIGSLNDFNFGFKSSLLIELRADSIIDGNNGFYVATSYQA